MIVTMHTAILKVWLLCEKELSEASKARHAEHKFGLSNPMASTYSTKSSPLSRSLLSPGWSEHVLRKKYRDPMKLKEFLDGIYGPGQYKVIVRSGCVLEHVRRERSR